MTAPVTGPVSIRDMNLNTWDRAVDFVAQENRRRRREKNKTKYTMANFTAEAFKEKLNKKGETNEQSKNE